MEELRFPAHPTDSALVAVPLPLRRVVVKEVADGAVVCTHAHATALARLLRRLHAPACQAFDRRHRVAVYSVQLFGVQYGLVFLRIVTESACKVGVTTRRQQRALALVVCATQLRDGCGAGLLAPVPHPLLLRRP